MKLISILFIAVVVSSCATPFNEQEFYNNGWYSKDEKRINRTKDLYACGSFYLTVARQRPNERQQYLDYSNKARKLAEKIRPTEGNISRQTSLELKIKYLEYGNNQSRKWLMEIANDKEGDFFPKITKDCYKKIQREDLIDVVDDLNEKFKKT